MSVDKVEHESVVLLGEVAGIDADELVSHAYDFLSGLNLFGVACLVNSCPVSRASTHAVVDAAAAHGIDLCQLQVGLALGAVKFSGIQECSACGAVAALSSIGEAEDDIGTVAVFLVGEALEGVLYILYSLAVLFLAPAHLAHARSLS